MAKARRRPKGKRKRKVVRAVKPKRKRVAKGKKRVAKGKKRAVKPKRKVKAPPRRKPAPEMGRFFQEPEPVGVVFPPPLGLD